MAFGDDITKRIRDLRKKQGLTQEALAEKIGMDLTSFSRIERGTNSNIQVNTLDRIIKGLNVDYQTFFAFKDSQDKKTQVFSRLTALENESEILDIIERIISLEEK